MNDTELSCFLSAAETKNFSATARYLAVTQQTVSGSVKLKLYKGNIINAGVTSPYSLYSERIASFGDDQHAYDQKNAAGFITLFGLPIAVRASMQQETEK